MISDKFSCARMWALTKRHAVENRRNIFISVGVMFGIILLISLLLTKSTDHDYDWRGSERGAILWMIYIWVASLVVQIAGSLTFSSMSTKSKRISNLMLPAKQSEKFVSQCLLYVVGGNIALILSLILADTLSATIFGFAPGWYYMPQYISLSDFDNSIPHVINFLTLSAFGVLWFFLFGQAIYVLGSAWWPRKSFLKTFVALFALQILIPVIIPLGTFFDVAGDLMKWIEAKDFSVNQVLAAGWCVLIFAYCLIAGIYALAWQRYKRLEIVKKFL